MIVLAGLVAGCGLVRRISFEEPTVTVTGIDLIGLDLSGGTLAVHLDVYNPNPYALRGADLTLEVRLEDTRFGSASHPGRFEFPAEEHADISLTADFTWKGIGRAAGAFISGGRVKYRATGRVTFQSAVGERRVPVELTGQMGLETP